MYNTSYCVTSKSNHAHITICFIVVLPFIYLFGPSLFILVCQNDVCPMQDSPCAVYRLYKLVSVLIIMVWYNYNTVQTCIIKKMIHHFWVLIWERRHHGCIEELLLQGYCYNDTPLWIDKVSLESVSEVLTFGHDYNIMVSRLLMHNAVVINWHNYSATCREVWLNNSLMA